MWKCFEAMSSPRSQHRRIRGRVELGRRGTGCTDIAKAMAECHKQSCCLLSLLHAPITNQPGTSQKLGSSRTAPSRSRCSTGPGLACARFDPRNKSLCKRQIRCSLVVGVRDRPRRPDIQASFQQQLVLHIPPAPQQLRFGGYNTPRGKKIEAIRIQ